MKLLKGSAVCLVFWVPILSLAQVNERLIEGAFYVKLKELESLSSGTAPSVPRFSLSETPWIDDFQPLNRTQSSSRSNTRSILDRLYKVTVNPLLDIDSLIRSVRIYENVEYAEPIYREKLLYTPNDPAIPDGNQSYLEQVQAFEAWDISRSSPEITIGIIDTGLDFGHEDIKNKIFTNDNEIPNNGTDDDGNGYVDDYQGYDLANNDHDAQSDGSIHGNKVGGLAGAETNNAMGMAGMGFDAMISPLKIFTTESNTSAGSYEAILYAADNGYDIINLSWGSTGSFSQANQDIIDYAVLEKDVVVVAAAGNSSTDEKFYPASYDHVLSIGASNLSNDTKADFSTYNYSVDLLAPGNNIYSATSSNSYNTDFGTSFATPLVSGTAALLKTHYPNLNARQLMELIRVTTDPVYNIPGNEPFSGKLGSGRLNAYRAVSEDQVKSLRASGIVFHSTVGPYAFYGDTITMVFSVTNFLGKIEDGSVHISSPSEFISIIDQEIYLGSLDTLESVNSVQARLYLNENTPADTLLAVRLDFTDTDYEDFQYVEFKTSPDHLVFDNNSLSIGISGDGNLGNFFGEGKTGSDLGWNGGSIASQMGFFVGDSVSYIADNINSSTALNDFSTTRNIKFKTSFPADHFAQSTFEDTTKFLVDQRLATNTNEDFLIIEYRITNNTGDTLKKITSGLYLDWEIADFTQNRSNSDPSTETLIAYNETSGIYTGIRPYYSFDKSFQALDLNSLNGNTQDIDALSDSLLYELGTSAVTFDSAGYQGAGNDIASIIAHRDLMIPPFESIRLAFMLALTPDKEQLNTELDKADSLYQVILNAPELLETYISCEGAALSIDPSSGSLYRFYSDPLAQNLLQENDTLFTGPINADTSYYLINLDNGYTSEIMRLEVKLVDQVADFSFTPDTLFLDNPSINTVTFEDLSFKPVSWQWDFGNGSGSTIQNPTVNFSTAGSYDISLEVENDLGCTGLANKTLLVAERPVKPEFSLNAICPGDEVVLTATNTDSIAVYSSSTANQPLLTGTATPLEPVYQDTCIYATNITGPFESLRQKVCIEVSEIHSSFSYLPDTTTATTNVLLNSTSTGSTSTYWYIDGNFVSTERVYSFEAQESSYEVSLVAESSSGCKDSITEIITFATSPTPVVEPLNICQGQSIAVEPGNGSFFAFYADASLDSLISKSKILNMEGVVDSLELFVVGLDSILPSPPVLAEINPEYIPLEILAEPDTLILSKQKTAQFHTDFENPKQLKWYYNHTVETVLNPVFFFDTAGVYSLIVEAESQRGCFYYDTLSYQVFKEPITTQVLATSDNKTFGISPNPIKNHLHLRSPKGERIISIKLLDLRGRVLLKLPVLNHMKELLYDFSAITPGMYMLTIETDKKVTSIKILKK